MIGLPHRVGAAFVVLGQANGTQKRVGHILNSNLYGGGSAAQHHTYFGNYPETTSPDYIITKTAGTLGEDYTYVSSTENTIPGNILKIVSYKTELNHYIPTYAVSADSNIPSYDSEGIWVSNPPPTATYSGYQIPSSVLNDPITGNNIEYLYINSLGQFSSFVTGFKNSWTEITDVTDNIGGDVEGFTPSIFYPRWTAEAAYDQSGQLTPPIEVSLTGDDPFYQTREGPAMTLPTNQIGTYWINPWTVGRVGGGLNQRLNIDCNVSYKFTNAGAHAADSVAEDIVYPLGKGYYNEALEEWFYPDYNKYVADQSARLKLYDVNGQFGGAIPAGSYRTTICTVFPLTDAEGDKSPYVNYENTATHGLFLAANGSCWNIGTELQVKVYIWKAPPKFCLYYRNKDKDGGGYPYNNWKTGSAYPPSAEYGGGYPPYVCPRIIGPGTGTFNDGDFRFEGGVNTGVDYSIPEPLNVDLHYWGTVFAPDTDSELNVEHEVLEFTVTIGEDNTYYCDGSPREGVEMTPQGFKLEDIVIPPVEGFITYIKDFEVTSITKPPPTPP